MKKYRTWTEDSYSGSHYLNWEFTDEKLKDEFETEIGYASNYTIRLADHKRPSVINGLTSYEHPYFYDAPDQEAFDVAVNYLEKILDKYCAKEITVEKLDDFLFSKHYDEMKKWLEENR